MKSSIALATACATLAVASPAVKHAIATETVLAYVTVTVTGTGPSPTAPAPVADSPAGAFFSTTGSSDDNSAPAPQAVSVPLPAVPSVDTSNLSGYAAPIIQAHNNARAQHSAPGLAWDDSLAAIALTIAKSCNYEHNTDVGGGGYGQNIAAGAAANTVNTVIYNSMYEDEISKYNSYGGEPDIKQLGNWGHATQIVWKSTTHVGCATFTCPSLANTDPSSGMHDFTVCNYSPAGNMIGSFAENVLPN